MPHLEFFDEGRIALAQEVRNHPDLKRLLAEQPADEFELKLAEIAAYCGVALEGEYYPSELDKLCTILRQKLIERRSAIVTTVGATKNDN